MYPILDLHVTFDKLATGHSPVAAWALLLQSSPTALASDEPSDVRSGLLAREAIPASLVL
jgi:hypothetical protein